MIIESEEVLVKNGTSILTILLKDENDVAVVPVSDSVKWNLINRPKYGETPTVINNRSNVAIASASTLNITLSGSDLSFLTTELSNKQVRRILIISYLYNSANGNNLSDKVQYEFKIENTYV